MFKPNNLWKVFPFRNQINHLFNLNLVFKNIFVSIRVKMFNKEAVRVEQLHFTAFCGHVVLEDHL